MPGKCGCEIVQMISGFRGMAIDTTNKLSENVAASVLSEILRTLDLRRTSFEADVASARENIAAQFLQIRTALESSERTALAAFDQDVANKRKRHDAQIDAMKVSLQQAAAKTVGGCADQKHVMSFDTEILSVSPVEFVLKGPIVRGEFFDSCWTFTNVLRQSSQTLTALQSLSAIISQEIAEAKALITAQYFAEESAPLILTNSEALYSGIAVNNSCTLLAAASWNHPFVTLFSLPSGTELRCIQDMTGRMLSADCICFGVNDNILTGDWASGTVHEFTAFGHYVRSIGEEGVCVNDIATNCMVIAICYSTEVRTFCYGSNLQIASFGDSITNPHFIGVCLSPEEDHVLVSDWNNHCIFIFHISGKFIRKIGDITTLYKPFSVKFSSFGDLVVSQNHQGGDFDIVVVSMPDGNSVKGVMKQQYISNDYYIATSSGKLFALEAHSNEVHVFT